MKCHKAAIKRCVLIWFDLLFCVWILVLTCSAQAESVIHVDGSHIVGTIRPLHGVNGGVLNDGETVDLSAYWKALGIPVTRLHDCEWPRPDVVDMHAVFPDLQADPNDPASYRFSATDDFIQAIVDTGAQIVYRLGESIEHTRRKQYVNPPANPEAWAAACLGIIRHYNHGWAQGFHHNIRYWEIWNEPENRPAMWTGTDQDYYLLYATAAKAIKAAYPDLLVGGPSLGATGEFQGETWQPIPFLQGFAEYCKDHQAPLDFFSWHTYTDKPYLYVRKAGALRQWLDSQSFTKTELHLNEWNYLPGNDWTPMLAPAQGEQRQQWFADIGGMPGAAFTAGVLSYLQESSLDVANYYSGDVNPFALFNRYGAPHKTYFAMLAFRRLLDTPLRLEARGWQAGETSVCAGINQDKNQVGLLLSYMHPQKTPCSIEIVNLPWSGPTAWSISCVDERHNLEWVDSGICHTNALQWDRTFSAPTVLLVECKPVASGKVVILDLDMPVVLVQAHPNVQACNGKIALQRGPLVYGFEGVDNGETPLLLGVNSQFKIERHSDLLGNIVAIHTHFANGAPLMAIPFYTLANRQKSWQDVWVSQEGFVPFKGWWKGELYRPF